MSFGFVFFYFFFIVGFIRLPIFTRNEIRYAITEFGTCCVGIFLIPSSTRRTARTKQPKMKFENEKDKGVAGGMAH